MSATDTELHITLDLQSIRDNGEAITSIGLEINSGSGFVPVVSYDGLSSVVTINAIDESITAGGIYQLQFRARNAIGWGPYSDSITAALVSPPLKPAAPTRDDSLSTKTGIAVRWTPVTDGASPAGLVTGYRLYQATGPSATFVMVYNGADFRTVHFRLVDQLETGQLYRFKVSAFNFNGEGPLSDELSTRSCVAPSSMQAPMRTDSRSSTLTLQWQQPSDDGGCAIKSYAVFRNDGLSQLISIEANADLDTNVRDRPTLRTLLITNFPANSAGMTFTFAVQAFNEIASSWSDSSSFILAGRPQPPTKPTEDV